MSAALDGAEWGVADAAALVGAIDAELAELAAADAVLVGKGRLDPREADWRKSVIADIRDDLLFAFAPLAEGEIRGTCDRNDHRVAWADKVRWLERELADRRARYPELVNKGRLTDADARRRIGALSRLHRLYWNNMFQWQPPEGAALDYLRALRDAASAGVRRTALDRSEGRRLYHQLVRAHLAELEREQDSGQGSLVA